MLVVHLTIILLKITRACDRDNTTPTTNTAPPAGLLQDHTSLLTCPVPSFFKDTFTSILTALSSCFPSHLLCRLIFFYLFGTSVITNIRARARQLFLSRHEVLMLGCEVLLQSRACSCERVPGRRPKLKSIYCEFLYSFIMSGVLL